MHGLLETIVHGKETKRVDVERIREIKRATGAFLTLHGGSGTSEADFRSAIEAGIDVVHINTELRLAWRRGLEKAFQRHPKEIVPYRLLSSVVEEEKSIVRARMTLFNETAQAA
jgi:fructose-bisphosphate aldolase class II